MPILRGSRTFLIPNNMTNAELITKIRRKVKELQDEFISIQPKDCSLKLIKSYAGYAYLDKVLSFIDTLEEPEKEQHICEEQEEPEYYQHFDPDC